MFQTLKNSANDGRKVEKIKIIPKTPLKVRFYRGFGVNFLSFFVALILAKSVNFLPNFQTKPTKNSLQKATNPQNSRLRNHLFSYPLAKNLFYDKFLKGAVLCELLVKHLVRVIYAY